MTTTAQFTEEATRKILQTKSGPIKINECGPANGRPVLFMHGVGPGASSWSNFGPNVQTLGQKYRCILVDAPGYTYSYELPPDTTEPRNTINGRTFKEVMDELGIEKGILIGNSMGGGAALACAIDYPDRIEKLITMGSGAGTTWFAQQPSEGIKVLWETYEDPSLENFRRLVRIMVYDASFATDEILKQRSDTAKAFQHHLDNFNESRRRGTMVQRNVEPDLPKIKAKTLITHGRNDRTVAPESALNLLARIPGSQLHMYNECAHWVQLEKLHEWNRLVQDFIDGD